MPESRSHKVIVTESVYKKAGYAFDATEWIRVVTASDDEETLSRVVSKENPVAVVIGSDRYSGSLYSSLQKGSLIARFGVGCDGVDFKKAEAYGLPVTNTPQVLEATVAELTVFLAGEVMRKVGYAHQQMTNGKWAPGIGKDLHGKVWAIVGMGAIGMKLSKILSFGFGVKVLAFKRDIREAESIQKVYGTTKLSSDFTETVSPADIVSIHIPAKDDTFHYLNADRLKLLKEGAILINTGRGSLIDEVALYDLLKSGKLGGAGLDVFENEPYVPVHPEKDLRTLPNVVMTPHIGSSTTECIDRMAKRVIQNIRSRIDGNYEAMDIKTA